MSEHEVASVTTKGGDKGFSSPRSGVKIVKSSPIFELLGTLDELNSFIGICCCYAAESVKKQLMETQHILFDIGGCLSINAPYSEKIKTFTTQLEDWSVELEKTLAPLDSFILPGGHVSAAHLHAARTICRRCERIAAHYITEAKTDKSLVEIPQDSDIVLVLLNRLSDYLFVAARFQNQINNTPEFKWTPVK